MDNDIDTDDALSNEFNKAASFIVSASFDVSVNDRLYLYSRYKQSTEGECTTVKPGIFDLQGKKKWEAWKGLKQLSKDEAMKQYIDKVTQLDSSWRLTVPAKTGWVSVSRMVKETSVDASEKNIFDFVQENELEKLKTFTQEELSQLDENKMTLLHWASDRGYVEMFKFLLKAIPQHVNTQDSEGQTPLHYAVSCTHEAIVQYLMEHKANPNIKDNDGLLPADLTDNVVIISMLKRSL